MGSSTWSDQTTIAPTPVGLTDDHKKEIIEYCKQPGHEDVPWDLTGTHFTQKFGFLVTGPEIFDIFMMDAAVGPK